MNLAKKLGLFTATLIIVADMVGSGILFTTGSILEMVPSAWEVLLLWGIGGILAISGALSYAKLAVIWPRAGGEYVYLKNIFGKNCGQLFAFLCGWVSLTVGFSGPLALTSIVFASYLEKFLQIQGLVSTLNLRLVAIITLIFFGIIHVLRVEKGGNIQNVLTSFKLLFFLFVIAIGLYLTYIDNPSNLTHPFLLDNSRKVFKFDLGIYSFALLLISFSYSGWNSTTYMAEEVIDAKKNLPRAIFGGTIIVIILYLAMNFFFLSSTPISKLKGITTIFFTSTENVFGTAFANWFNLGIGIILLSSISVQLMVAPRVYYAMARDGVIFKFLGKTHPRYQTPYLAVMIQMLIAIGYVIIGKNNIEMLMTYMGFTLSIFPTLVVVGLIKTYYQEGSLSITNIILPLVYILLSLLIMITALIKWTSTSLFAITVLIVGGLVYYLWSRQWGPLYSAHDCT
ncbi:MAG: amino acid permease [Oligoflexia bacterium]|nr:amino acid permease [Oligoflexia bacterium]